MNVCHETIYDAIYAQAKDALRFDLKQALRKGRARSRPRGGGQERIGTLVERSDRSAILLNLPDGHGADQVQDAICQDAGPAQTPGQHPGPGPSGRDGPARQDRPGLDMRGYFSDPYNP